MGDEAIERLRELQLNSDFESAHGEADAVLCALLVKLGYGAVVDEWEKVGRWYA